MRMELAFGMVCIAGTIVGVKYIDRTHPSSDQSPATLASATTPSQSQTPSSNSPYQAGWKREVHVPAGHDRQFRVTASVNRQAVSFLIDTGASFVALRESDARRAGIYLKSTDYTAPVSTANGVTKAARVSVDQIEIDGLLVRGVDTFILPDNQLGMNLLGMSYLSELESVEARGNEMILRG